MSRYRTPLRYPGGKQRLAPFILELLVHNRLLNGHYVEPYAGGAGVALELLLGGYVSHIHLNDSSLPIYAFWRAILTQPEELCRRILTAPLTVEEWKRRREVLQNPTEYNDLEIGFSTFYLNRCNRSGVLSGGLIGGLDQSGKWKMDARFQRMKLVRRIEAIADLSASISINNWDAEKYIQEYIPNLPANTLVYCDPPYFAQTSYLYLNRYQKKDHARLATVIQRQLRRKWIVSYDGAQEILSYYRDRRAFLYNLQYNAARVYKGQEVFIFSDALRVPKSSSLSYINQAIGTCRKARRLISIPHAAAQD